MKYLEPILVFVVAVFSLILSINKWSNLSNTNRMIAVSIIAFLLIIAIVQITNIATDKVEKDKEKEKQALVERIEAKYGDINLQGSDSGAIGGSRMDDNIWIKNRDGTYLAHIYNGEYHEDPVPLMNIKFVNKKLIINTVIRDFNGKAIAAIEDGVWTVFGDDFEYNDDGVNNFEMVTKGERDVHFQIITKDDKTLITGYFLNKDGNGFLYQYNSESDKVFPIYGINKKTKKLDRRKIERKFKYPRGKFYGQKIVTTNS